MMTTMRHFVHNQHDEHDHGPGCGHVAVRHDDHVDYVHDGHLHFVHGRHVDEHDLAHGVADRGCAPGGDAHRDRHEHGVDCGHEAVPHAGHMDYLVDGQLHRSHDDHCDDHGLLPTP